MAGRKSKILIDSIDFEILIRVSNKNKYWVLYLAEKIGLTHTNIKNHLVKLTKMELVDLRERDNQRLIINITKKGKKLVEILKWNVTNAIMNGTLKAN